MTESNYDREKNESNEVVNLAIGSVKCEKGLSDENSGCGEGAGYV